MKSVKKKKYLPLTSEQKRAKAVMGIGITFAIIFLIAMIIVILALMNAGALKAITSQAGNFNKVTYEENKQLTPVKDVDGYYTFTTDSAFKVLQLTDIHIGGGIFSQKNDAWALNAVSAMITEEKPDLVIITGDIAYPVPFSAGTFNNMNATKIFATMMEKLGVYWTFTYGNHDTEVYSYYTREDLNNFYVNSNLHYCLYQRGNENISGFGNSIIKVKNTSGVVTQALVTLDSHSYTDGDALGMLWKYDNLHQDQIEWYEREIKKINISNKQIDENAQEVKNMAFFHIPIPEYRDAWAEYVNNDKQSTDNVIYKYGVMNETMKENSSGQQTYGVYCGVGQDEFFETGKDNGLQAIFCGHDHYNNFSVEYKGIRLTYGMSTDYLAYPGIWNEKAQRGCTLITINSDGTFDCEPSNYYQNKYKAQLEKQ